MTGTTFSGKGGSPGPPIGAVDPAAPGPSTGTMKSRGTGPTPPPTDGSGPPSASASATTPEAPTALDPSYRVSPRLTLLSLALCLVGFVDFAVQLYAFKFLGVGPSFHGIPSRVLFVFGLTLVVAPLVLAIFRRPPLLFVLPSIALVFLISPLFAPSGIPYGPDAIFNFQFASSILQNGRWAPGLGVVQQAVAYSYYPGSGVFNAELAAFTGVPLVQTFQWGIPLLRLLILPAAVYAIGNRYFGQRVGLVSILVFLATPSILFNYPVQSEFAIPFFALTLVVVGYLVVDPRLRESQFITAAVLFASFVVISHHLTTYALAAWFGVLLVLGAALHRRLGSLTWRAVVVMASFFAFFAGFTLWVSLPSFVQNYNALISTVNSLLNPSSLSASTATSLGASFPEYQLAWSYLAYLAIILISILTLRRWLGTQRRRFTTPNLIAGIIAVLAALPMLVTSFSFLAERIMEYSEIFMAPAVAWWVAHWFSPGPGSRAPRPRLAGPLRRVSPVRRSAVTLGVLMLVVLIFSGASLVPYSTRDQFASPAALTTESPLHIDQNSYALALWAHAHLTSSTYVWGDTLVQSVFGGFGQFNMRYDQYAMFNGTTISPTVWALVSVGSYVVLDKYLNTTTPQFPGGSEPTAPLTAAELAKFNDPTYFDLVYQDSTYTIYEVIAVP